jgi:phosphohistidine phosphatase SixA
MRVLFLRHAEAVESSGFEGSDLERPLTGKGRRTMKAVARVVWPGVLTSRTAS